MFNQKQKITDINQKLDQIILSQKFLYVFLSELLKKEDIDVNQLMLKCKFKENKKKTEL